MVTQTLIQAKHSNRFQKQKMKDPGSRLCREQIGQVRLPESVCVATRPQGLFSPLHIVLSTQLGAGSPCSAAEMSDHPKPGLCLPKRYLWDPGSGIYFSACVDGDGRVRTAHAWMVVTESGKQRFLHPVICRHSYHCHGLGSEPQICASPLAGSGSKISS